MSKQSKKTSKQQAERPICSSILKTEAVYFTETSVNYDKASGLLLIMP
jgi:hypothetical protein